LSAKFCHRPHPRPRLSCRAVYAQITRCPQIVVRGWRRTVAPRHGGPMTTTTSAGGARGILAVLAESALRDEIDRVAAAVGVRAVHVSATSPVSRKSWSAAAAVVLDEAAAEVCAHTGLPRRAHVIVVTGGEPTSSTWAAAIEVGARHVLRLPAQEHELVRELADAGESVRDNGARGQVVAVIGGRGGAGASLFAVALAQLASDPLLVDLDPWGGGIDLLVGGETTPGVRWPDLALQGGRLNWSAVREALPRHRGISMLSGTRREYEMDARAVDAVIDAGRRGGATVVCDLPRRVTDAAEIALDTADLVVVVSPCDVRACAATTTMAPALTGINPNVGLVVRGPSPGGLRAEEVAAIAAVPLLASMKPHPRLAEQLEHGGLRLRQRSALAAAASQVLAVLPARPAAKPKGAQGRVA
jgi:secretion/DNA translocation related CpaE-like protein